MNQSDFEQALAGCRVMRQDKDADRNPNFEWVEIPARLLWTGLTDNVRDIGTALVALQDGVTYFGIYANYRIEKPKPITKEN